MGLDIYAGTLTRYYSHNWKTVVQQWAEENGYTFNRITPDGEPADNEEELSPAEVQAAVEDWRDQILTAISQPNQPPYTPWPEDNERPYYTDKPDWDAFGAMLLVAACHDILAGAVGQDDSAANLLVSVAAVNAQTDVQLDGPGYHNATPYEKILFTRQRD